MGENEANDDDDFFGVERMKYNDDLQFLDKNGQKMDKKKFKIII